MFVLFISLLCLRIANSLTFRNEIQGEPQVECGQGKIMVRVKTTSQNPSFIFAKGHFQKEGCVFKNTSIANFTLEECNINKKREISPRGMAYSLTIIVQLHPLFITKVDRAYNLHCFYMEANRMVDAELGVSDLTTILLESGYVVPQCSYSLHRDSPNGPMLRYAHVGDIVYHVWDCPSDVYAMLVHTCFILDGHGDEHEVVDSKGCPVDDFILPRLTYSSDLSRSFTGASVVNLPDRDSIYFTCQIKLCFKEGDYCNDVTPPRCDTPSLSVKSTMEDELRNDQLIPTTASPATSNFVKIISEEISEPSTRKNEQITESHKKETTKNNHREAPVILHETTTEFVPETPNATETIMQTGSTISPVTIFEIDPIMKGNHQELITKQFDLKKQMQSLYMTTVPMKISNFSSGNKPQISDSFPTSSEFIRSELQNSSLIADGDDIEGSGIEIASSVPKKLALDSKFTRDRRTTSKNKYGLMDLDVSTPQLKILDQGFELPDISSNPQTLNDQRNNVCVPLIGLWFLFGASVISISVAVYSVCRLRLSKKRFFPVKY